MALLFWGYQKIERFADTPLAIQQETIFKLPAGTGRVALEGLLVRDKLVRNGRWFQWLLKLEPELAEFKAGTYRFTPGMTVRQMLKLLASGKRRSSPHALSKAHACVTGSRCCSSPNT